VRLPTLESDAARNLLRRYLLDTLSPRARRTLETRLAEDDAWRSALDAERARLNALDALPAMPPSRNLTDATLKAVAADPPTALHRRWLPQAAVAIMAVSLGAVLLFPAISRSRDAADQYAAENNLERIAIVFKLYSRDARHAKLPPVTPYRGALMFDLRAVYPHYLEDPAILINPRLPNAERMIHELRVLMARKPVDWEAVTRLLARNYTYLGWQAEDDAEFRAIASRLERLTAQEVDEDLSIGGSEAERMRAAPSVNPARVPVLFENVYSAKDGRLEGVNVLYADGRVRHLHMGEAYPATDSVADVLREQAE
jgi:prepilin-type processing-associated H-X9-DG protein